MRPQSTWMAALAEAPNTLSVGLHEAAAQGPCVNDTDLCNGLTGLDVSPGKPGDYAAIDAATVWATSNNVEDEDGMVETVRIDGQGMIIMMVGKVLDSGIADGDVSDSESERGGYESTGVGAIAEPPSYAQVPSYFGPLEVLRSRVGMTRPHTICRRPECRLSRPIYASTTARQADCREFVRKRMDGQFNRRAVQ